MDRGLLPNISVILQILLSIPYYMLLEVVYFIFRCRPQKQIQNQHVLITGASGGIGAEYALRFCEMGNTVHCLDINGDINEKMVAGLKEQGFTAYAYECDITNSVQLESVYQQITDKGFVITYLINNAGIAYGRSITALSHTQIQRAVEINLTAQLWVVKVFLPKMREVNQGHIVNMASLAGLMPICSAAEYCSSKAGSYHMANQLRMELARTNISVTAVCPFFIRTKFITGLEDHITNTRGCPLISAEELVETVIRGIKEDKHTIIAPSVFRVACPILNNLPEPLNTCFATWTINQDKIVEEKYIGRGMLDKIK